MHVNLPFGGGALPVDIPDNWINGRLYRSRPLQPAGDARAEVMTALGQTQGLSSFMTTARNRRDACVLVDAKSRGIFTELLPAFLEELEDASGLNPKKITVLVSNSVWNARSEADLRILLPEAIQNRYPVALHDPADMSQAVEVGNLPGGIPYVINGHYARADLKLVLSTVQPHMLHGFTGVRSALLSSISYDPTLRRVYSYANMEKPGVRFGMIRENPLQSLGGAAVETVGCDAALSCLVTPTGQVSAVFLGEPQHSFLEAVHKLRENMGVELKEPMDIVVTGGGGFPHDASLLQAMDALGAAERVLKPEGSIILVAECAMGFGPKRLRDLLLVGSGPRGFLERLRETQNYFHGQALVQRLFNLMERHEIIVHSSGLAEDDLWKIGMTPTGGQNLQEVILGAMEEHGQRCKIACLPDGPFCLPSVADELASSTAARKTGS